MTKDKSYLAKVKSVKDIARDVGSFSVDPSFFVKESMNIIEKHNDVLNCVVSIDKNSIESQLKILEEKLNKGVKLPLAGVPVIVKDNICTSDFPTTACSKMLQGFYPTQDAFVVNELKHSGCIIVGKANCDEFAMGNSNENSFFGPVSNPWNISKVSGGSSGGSAVAVASGMVPLTLGSDTGGSIRQPASLCGVVGLKPTYGHVSRRGLIAYASSLDQIGPLGQKVEDVALAMEIIGCHDPLDSTCVDENERRGIQKRFQKRGKIGVIKEFFDKGINSDISEEIGNQIQNLKSLGYQVETISIPLLEAALAAYYIIATAEASSNLARYDGVRYGYRTKESVRNLDQLYRKSRSEGFSSEVKKRIMLGTFVLSHGYFEAYYDKARKVRKNIQSQFYRLFNEFDFLIGPTSPVTAFDKGKTLEDSLASYLLDVCTISVNLAGLPAISIPVGLDRKGLPIGLQVIGQPFDESSLVSIAEKIEKKAEFSRHFN
jgi:aspartyl-tRNA(Asn)/glutamyl-tRNA(Gln) amidotransferase subunit A